MSIRTLALVREPSDALTRCELTHQERAPIDLARARRQHRAYVDLLSGLGLEVVWLPALPAQADGVFVEDMAVVLPEIAVIGRSGAASRRGEAGSVAEALSAHRPLRWVEPPGTLDGGDVMRIGRRFYVGSGGRTNAEGAAALENSVSEFGYSVTTVPLVHCLHLKSAVTFIPPDKVLVNPRFLATPAVFADVQQIAVDEREPGGANTLTVGGTTLASSAYPRTADRLRRAGVHVREIDVSELHKAEAGLTCMSLIVAASARKS